MRREERDFCLEHDGVNDPLLQRFNTSWYHRARVKHAHGAIGDAHEFSGGAPDFLEELLPFRNSKLFHDSPPELKARCLSTGWLIYNLKTISIEGDIICQAVIDLLRNQVPGDLSYREASSLSQVLVDEAFHLLICVDLCEMTTRKRGLKVTVPPFDLTASLSAHRRTRDPVDFSLIRLAYATVSETFISDYLALLSDSKVIQPLFREAVATHRADEMVHRKLFPLVLQPMLRACTDKQKFTFVDGIIEAIRLFSSRESRLWQAVLSQLYEDWRKEGLETPRCDEKIGVADYSALPAVLDSLGLYDNVTIRMRVTDVTQEVSVAGAAQ